MMDNTAVLQQEMQTISQQQQQILAALAAMRDGSATILRADVTAGTARLEKELDEQKKSSPIFGRPLPSLRLELIAWKREPGGIRRFYRAIGG